MANDMSGITSGNSETTLECCKMFEYLSLFEEYYVLTRNIEFIFLHYCSVLQVLIQGPINYIL